MGFDWGGFAGGIIGTVGAFGVAFYTLRNQDVKEKPKSLKQTYITLSSVYIILNQAHFALAEFDGDVIGHVLKTGEYILELEKLIPEAIEAGGEVLSVIEKNVDAIYEVMLGDHDDVADYKEAFHVTSLAGIAMCHQRMKYIRTEMLAEQS